MNKTLDLINILAEIVFVLQTIAEIKHISPPSYRYFRLREAAMLYIYI